MDRPPVLLPFAYVEDATNNFVALVLPDDVGRRRLRFLFRYQGGLRAMAWMTVGSDGSLYLNPRLHSNSVFLGSAVADGDGGFNELELEEIDLRDLDDPNPHLSHHASGVVKGADRRSSGVSPRSVTENTVFRQDDYAHPSRFAVIAEHALRATDVVVPTIGYAPFELDEERPLTSRIMVAQLTDGEAQVTRLDDAPVGAQTALVLPYTNLAGCQDLTYQITFFNGAAGQWPDLTTAAVLKV
jgi:hypothetical protein